MIVCDVWGGNNSMDHLARYILPIKEALVWAEQEIEKGFLINMRKDIEFGLDEQFDFRKETRQ